MAKKHRVALMLGITYGFWFVYSDTVTAQFIFLVLMSISFIAFAMMEDK